jgi:hypothetical protein
MREMRWIMFAPRDWMRVDLRRSGTRFNFQDEATRLRQSLGNQRPPGHMVLRKVLFATIQYSLTLRDISQLELEIGVTELIIITTCHNWLNQ